MPDKHRSREIMNMASKDAKADKEGSAFAQAIQGQEYGHINSLRDEEERDLYDSTYRAARDD